MNWFATSYIWVLVYDHVVKISTVLEERRPAVLRARLAPAGLEPALPRTHAAQSLAFFSKAVRYEPHLYPIEMAALCT